MPQQTTPRYTLETLLPLNETYSQKEQNDGRRDWRSKAVVHGSVMNIKRLCMYGLYSFGVHSEWYVHSIGIVYSLSESIEHTRRIYIVRTWSLYTPDAHTGRVLRRGKWAVKIPISDHSGPISTTDRLLRYTASSIIADTALTSAPFDAMRGSGVPTLSESDLRPDSIGVSRQQAVFLL